MSTKLPVVQSIPHGGLAVPQEVRDILAIDEVTIYNECDLWVEHLFDFAHPDLPGPDTLGRVNMPIARVFIDANRPPDDLDNPDGPVKTQTSYGDPIYTTPLSRAMKETLLQRYWRPYHRALDGLIRQHAPEMRLFLDCHNMAQEGPTAYADPGQARPLVDVINNGDANGEYVPEYGSLTAPPWLARAAAEMAQELFQDMELLEPVPGQEVATVKLNQPFRGGYILRYYASQAYRRTLPPGSFPYVGLMVEVNRGLFVGRQTTRTPIAPPNQERIAAIRERLYRWTTQVLALIRDEEARILRWEAP